MKTWNKFFEALDDTVGDKISEKYKSLKKGILELLDKQLGDDANELGNVQNFITDFLEENETLDEFVENSDIFDFYLKYQSDIDSILDDEGYFDEAPTSNNIYSLYDYVIEGSKFAVNKALEIIKEEIFK